jgi:hypothetical protein
MILVCLDLRQAVAQLARLSLFITQVEMVLICSEEGVTGFINEGLPCIFLQNCIL